MNDPFCFVLIFWQSRNFKKRGKAIELCKDYGLEPVLKNIYLGKVRRVEVRFIKKSFYALFVNKTDIFYLFQICKNCLNNSESFNVNDFTGADYEIV